MRPLAEDGRALGIISRDRLWIDPTKAGIPLPTQGGHAARGVFEDFIKASCPNPIEGIVGEPEPRIGDSVKIHQLSQASKIGPSQVLDPDVLRRFQRGRLNGRTTPPLLRSSQLFCRSIHSAWCIRPASSGGRVCVSASILSRCTRPTFVLKPRLMLFDSEHHVACESLTSTELNSA